MNITIDITKNIQIHNIFEYKTWNLLIKMLLLWQISNLKQ